MNSNYNHSYIVYNIQIKGFHTVTVLNWQVHQLLLKLLYIMGDILLTYMYIV